jgi:predicted ATP-grasp superfamily ATP-dependent carboligase
MEKLLLSNPYILSPTARLKQKTIQFARELTNEISNLLMKKCKKKLSKLIHIDKQLDKLK